MWLAIIYSLRGHVSDSHTLSFKYSQFQILSVSHTLSFTYSPSVMSRSVSGPGKCRMSNLMNISAHISQLSQFLRPVHQSRHTNCCLAFSSGNYWVTAWHKNEQLPFTPAITATTQRLLHASHVHTSHHDIMTLPLSPCILLNPSPHRRSNLLHNQSLVSQFSDFHSIHFYAIGCLWS